MIIGQKLYCMECVWYNPKIFIYIFFHLIIKNVNERCHSLNDILRPWIDICNLHTFCSWPTRTKAVGYSLQTYSFSSQLRKAVLTFILYIFKSRHATVPNMSQRGESCPWQKGFLIINILLLSIIVSHLSSFVFVNQPIFLSFKNANPFVLNGSTPRQQVK